MRASRHILITGASSGIGFRAAVRLLRAGHRLTLPCRDAERAAASARGIAAAASSAVEPQTLVADLADLESVNHCCEQLLARGEAIDTLVLNAGLQYTGAREPRRSAQGHELTIAVNHLAHQLLGQHLLPLLEAGREPRLVVTASEVHDPTSSGGRVGQPAGLGDLAGLRQGAGFAMVDGRSPFDADKAYKDSKLCNVLFARRLQQLLEQRGRPLPVIAWSPGLVIPRASDGFFRYSRQHNEAGQRLFALVARDLLRLTETAERAGALLAGLAADPAHGRAGFHYWCNRVLGPGRRRFEAAEPSAEARNDALAAELWTLSAGLVGQG
ncbi:MAG: SDR family NAD(P)-dependent oxidoreductase [Cyanobium sp. PLM2.Bin73]|nr:MAG: SDR family NAD(P)-dependent oxidoreductase [Cyanobium sp. PLM2.Bin73]